MAFILLIVIAFFFLLVVLFGTLQSLSRRRVLLSGSLQRTIVKHWQQALSLPDDNRAVLEFDKVLAQTLKGAGYDGSVGDQLKAAGDRLPQLEEIWWAHKLRNTVAHEPGFTVSPTQRKRATRAYYAVVRSFVPSLPK